MRGLLRDFNDNSVGNQMFSNQIKQIIVLWKSYLSVNQLTS